jgi:hypothetical protein
MFWENFCQKVFKKCGMPPFLMTQFEKLWQLNGDHIFKNCPSFVGDRNKQKGVCHIPHFLESI